MDQNQTNSELKKDGTYKETIVDFIQNLTIFIVLFLVMYFFIATPNQIEGKSMEPTFEHNDIIVTNKLPMWLSDSSAGSKLGLSYKRGDVIVFQKKPYDKFIKRVIGLPGENVSIKDGKILINGTILQEPYLKDTMITTSGSFLIEGGEAKTIGQREYLALGDNRSNSHDSRSIDIGFVKEEWILGKVLLKYWPITEAKILHKPDYNI